MLLSLPFQAIILYSEATISVLTGDNFQYEGAIISISIHQYLIKTVHFTGISLLFPMNQPESPILVLSIYG